jgi:formylglycine-generating enzyme
MQKLSTACIVILLLIGNSSFKKKSKLVVVNSAKSIQKTIKQITPTLYAWQTEVSNAQYQVFIDAMKLANSNTYMQYKVDSMGWINETIAYNQPFAEVYHRHPAFANYPVVNVSYANAIAYCNWLTNLYNNDESRKFKKVQFALPTVEEWEVAASGNRKQAIYSWGSYHTRNNKGNYNGNFREPADVTLVTDSTTGLAKQEVKNSLFKLGSNGGDKQFYTASCTSYWPNDFGLYNCSGNVAEMVATEGIAKGGSWHSFSGEITIQSKMNYTSSGPQIGFRVFMKVIEE